MINLHAELSDMNLAVGGAGAVGMRHADRSAVARAAWISCPPHLIHLHSNESRPEITQRPCCSNHSKEPYSIQASQHLPTKEDIK